MRVVRESEISDLTWMSEVQDVFDFFQVDQKKEEDSFTCSDSWSGGC